jgi:hypothetical protein
MAHFTTTRLERLVAATSPPEPKNEWYFVASTSDQTELLSHQVQVLAIAGDLSHLLPIRSIMGLKNFKTCDFL